MDPITDAREITRIAYGFKASKALLVAIDLDIFSRLSATGASLAELADATAVPESNLGTLLTALVSMGLLSRDGDRFANAPACEDYLVRGKRTYFGDYFNLQTDQFIFPGYADLGAVIRRQGRSDVWHDYESLMQDDATAARFSEGQHAGSLGPAVALSKQLDLGGRGALLDVAGGSGAFTIMLCRRHPGLSATILDFPTALPVAERFLGEAGLADRVDLHAGNAIDDAWPAGHDMVLMSYLFNAVAGRDLAVLAGNAFAALWFLTCMFNVPEAIVLTPAVVEGIAGDAGFTGIETRDLIPGLTKMTVALKP